MKKYSELLEEQEKVKRKVKKVKEILGYKNLKIKDDELFKLAEILVREDWLIIYVLREGINGEKLSYAEIGRKIGKNRAVVRRKYLSAKQKIWGEGNVYKIK
ncbi:MAG TPA: hypothetical protein PLS98_09775 [Dictyoglomaceae bacterium]|nr:hypothetical protein [Dictyoglomaceae bacterium]